MVPGCCFATGGSSYPLQKLLELPPGQRVAAELKVVDSRWNQRWLEAHPADRAIAERMTAAGQDQQDLAAIAAYGAQLQARERHDVWDRLGAITCPVLVGYGNYDGIAPAQNSINIASRIRGAELHGYEGGNGPQVGGGLTRWHAHLKVSRGGRIIIAGFGVALRGHCDPATWTDQYTTQMLHVWVVPYPGGVFSDDLSTAATTAAAKAALAETRPGQLAP